MVYPTQKDKYIQFEIHERSPAALWGETTRIPLVAVSTILLCKSVTVFLICKAVDRVYP